MMITEIQNTETQAAGTEVKQVPVGHATKDYYYDLPEELIAQDPLEDRSSSRLMVLHRPEGSAENETQMTAPLDIEHRVFRDIIEFLQPGETLILNNTKVIPARLLGTKILSEEARKSLPHSRRNTSGSASDPEEAHTPSEEGAAVEILLLKRRAGDVWETLVRPGKKLKPGAEVTFGDGSLTATILEVVEDGNRLVQFHYQGIFEEVLDRLGEMPLPPYITHHLQDKNRYQTVYAKYEGSAAAPTAGLHFTPELLEQIRAKGVNIGYVTLHVGLGTFRPVKVDDVTEHHMHTEWYNVPEETAELINRTKAAGKRVICVGTTSCRTVESAADEDGTVRAGADNTSIFIYPGYRFRVMDALITNFHLPESTLIMLVSAFAGRERILAAYEEAVRERYRFFSFGDAMYIE